MPVLQTDKSSSGEPHSLPLLPAALLPETIIGQRNQETVIRNCKGVEPVLQCHVSSLLVVLAEETPGSLDWCH